MRDLKQKTPGSAVRAVGLLPDHLQQIGHGSSWRNRTIHKNGSSVQIHGAGTRIGYHTQPNVAIASGSSSVVDTEARSRCPLSSQPCRSLQGWRRLARSGAEAVVTQSAGRVRQDLSAQARQCGTLQGRDALYGAIYQVRRIVQVLYAWAQRPAILTR